MASHPRGLASSCVCVWHTGGRTAGRDKEHPKPWEAQEDSPGLHHGGGGGGQSQQEMQTVTTRVQMLLLRKTVCSLEEMHA